MICAIQYPSWIKPEIIPGFPFLRWYGFMYLVAFTIAFVLFKVQVKKGELQRYAKSEKPITNEDIIDFFTWSLLGLMLGARIFATHVYEPTWRYWQKPWLIFWPFSEAREWTGLQGMSYHGGFIGCFLGAFLWTKQHKQDFFAWADTAAAGIPLGYTFGRIGNFFNGELYGRITASPIGMIFPSVPLHDCFPVKEEWVREFAAKAGVAIQEGAQYVNLPRHPSQLYEALFEGVLLWVVVWLVRNKKPFNGFLFCFYTIGYGFVRFFIEYFRQPDYELGFRIAAAADKANIYIFNSFKNISTGQIFCFMMIAGGLIGIALLARYNRKRQRG